VASETTQRRRAAQDPSASTGAGEAREEIQRTEEAELDAHTANLFDIRRVIGGLFLLYGAILIVVGATASDADLAKASGINVNLWTGIGMAIFGGLMLAWAMLHPVGADLERSGSGRLRRAPS
jgi:hypothetical protein